MKKQLLAMMNESEQQLLRDIHDGDLAALDEEALIVLHGRVRRARNKYSKLYRRRSAEAVEADGSRATASATTKRTARKAEIFERAMAKVSRRLAKVSRANADELKQERLAAARGTKKPKPAAAKREVDAKTSLPHEKKKRRTGASERSSAQARAATRQKQAKRAAKV